MVILNFINCTVNENYVIEKNKKEKPGLLGRGVGGWRMEVRGAAPDIRVFKKVRWLLQRKRQVKIKFCGR